MRQMLCNILDDKFVKECNTNKDLINPLVAENIDFKNPEEGQVYLRLVQLAKERNIEYNPSHAAC